MSAKGISHGQRPEANREPLLLGRGFRKRISRDFLQRLRQHARSRLSYERQREILEAWFGLCAESPDGVVDREALCEQVDITRSGLIHHLKALEGFDMVARSERRPDARRRRVVCYELKAPSAGGLPEAGDPGPVRQPPGRNRRCRHRTPRGARRPRGVLSASEFDDLRRRSSPDKRDVQGRAPDRVDACAGAQRRPARR